MLTLFALFLFFIMTLVLVAKWKKAWMLSIVTLSLMAFLVEASFALREVLYTPNRYHYEASIKYKQRDPIIRNWFKPNTSVLVSKYYDDGTVVFDSVKYSFDEKGRRKCSPENNAAPLHALFFGGSFTLGMGVPDDANLPSQFANINPSRYQTFNFGGGGFGTGEMLALLNRDSLFDDISQPEGIAIYNFIPDHLVRSTGMSLDRFSTAFSNNAVFYFKENSNRLAGPVKYKDYPRLKRSIDNLNLLKKHSAFLRYYFSKYSWQFLSEKDAVAITADIIIEARNSYNHRFNGRFIVIFWPRVRDNIKVNNLRLLKEILNKEGIETLEPIADLPLEEAQIHPRDRHPSRAEYKKVALLLDQYLESSETSLKH